MSRFVKKFALPLSVGIASILTCPACTPDLHETTGPIVRGPNLTGTVVREGVPISDLKVKLEITDRDSTIADDRTDTAGRFAFTDVGIGNWTIRADSAEPTDFDKVTIDFVFLTADTTLEIPALEISLDGLELKSPDDEARLPVPRFTDPIFFDWDRPNDPAATVQVQVFGSDGQAFWYSDRTLDDTARWNGIGNRGENAGKTASVGSYRWRLRVERPNSRIESSTAYRLIEFTEQG